MRNTVQGPQPLIIFLTFSFTAKQQTSLCPLILLNVPVYHSNTISISKPKFYSFGSRKNYFCSAFEWQQGFRPSSALEDPSRDGITTLTKLSRTLVTKTSLFLRTDFEQYCYTNIFIL